MNSEQQAYLDFCRGKFPAQPPVLAVELMIDEAHRQLREGLLPEQRGGEIWQDIMQEIALAEELLVELLP